MLSTPPEKKTPVLATGSATSPSVSVAPSIRGTRRPPCHRAVSATPDRTPRRSTGVHFHTPKVKIHPLCQREDPGERHYGLGPSRQKFGVLVSHSEEYCEPFPPTGFVEAEFESEARQIRQEVQRLYVDVQHFETPPGRKTNGSTHFGHNCILSDADGARSDTETHCAHFVVNSRSGASAPANSRCCRVGFRAGRRQFRSCHLAKTETLRASKSPFWQQLYQG